MDINEILQYLPHRYPFLLADRVLEINREPHPGAQERDDERAVLSGALPHHR